MAEKSKSPGRPKGAKTVLVQPEKTPGCDSLPLQATEREGTNNPLLKKVSYTHDAMIDEIIRNPAIEEKELAELFGFSKAWVSRVVCSDAFLQRLAVRKHEVIDPALTASAEERIRNVEFRSLDIVQRALDARDDTKLAVQVLNLTMKSRAYGARTPGNTNIQNNFVVALPTPSPDAETWAAQYSGNVIDVESE